MDNSAGEYGGGTFDCALDNCILYYNRSYYTGANYLNRGASRKQIPISFSYECEGRFYALGLWSMKATSYTNAAKHFFTARKIGHLKSGYSARAWTLTTKCEKYGNNFAHIPIVRPGAVSNPAFLEFAKNITG